MIRLPLPLRIAVRPVNDDSSGLALETPASNWWWSIRNASSMKAEYDFSKGKRGAAIPQKGKTRISIFIDNSVLEAFRSRAETAGTGYQTMMNDALRKYLSETDQPITEKMLRQVLREEIPEYVRGQTTRSTRSARKRAAG